MAADLGTGLNLRLGDRLEVLMGDKRAVAVVEETTPKGRLIITAPLSGTSRVLLSKREKLNVFAFQGSGILNFSVTVEGFSKENGMDYVEVEVCSKVNRLQRRDFVRYDTLLPITIVPLIDGEAGRELSDNAAVTAVADQRLSGKAEEEEKLSGFTLDISGGGLRFFCKKTFEMDSVFDCDVYLDDGDKISASMRIMRVEHEKYDGNTIMGARFIGIADTLRERLIKYIFNEQLKKRRTERRGRD